MSMEALGRMDRRQTGRCNPKGMVDGPGLAQPRAVFSLRCSEILHWGCGVVPLLTHLALDQIGKDFGQDPCQAVYKILDGRGSGSEKKKKAMRLCGGLGLICRGLGWSFCAALVLALQILPPHSHGHGHVQANNKHSLRLVL